MIIAIAILLHAIALGLAVGAGSMIGKAKTQKEAREAVPGLVLIIAIFVIACILEICA